MSLKSHILQKREANMSQTLFIIAHGSRSAAWNHAIETFCSNIRPARREGVGFDDVKWCYLEHAQPTIQEALDRHCQTSGNEVVAIPVFLTLGQHVTVDIPKRVEEVANLLEWRNGIAYYECKGRPVRLFQPPPTAELLADNIARRYKRWVGEVRDAGLMIVYYGSKKYISAWNHLGFNVQSNLMNQFPGLQVNWSYVGDAVDHSPEPLAEALTDMSFRTSKIVLLPAMVSVGVTQNEIVPAAIELAGLLDRIVYPGDAILPDSELERRISDHVLKILLSEKENIDKN